MSSYQIFGFSESSDVTPLSVGFVVIVGYLVLAEYSLSWLDEACRSTAYAQAVQSLYKELVIMGMSGFILTILLGTNIVDNNAWVYYLEIADVTLFFSALLHVFFSFSLILNNVTRNRSLKEKLAVDVHQLVDEISTSTAFRWNPFSDLRSQLELRVMRIMFLKQFKLDRAFDFARYVIRSEEHHIMQMLHVSPTHWAFFVAGVALNFIRVKYHLHGPTFQHQVHRLCSGIEDSPENKECETATSQCLLFTLMLFGFLIVLLVMALTSRFYVLRLMRINGPEKASQSCEYLLEDEIHDVQAQGSNNDGRMTLKNMKQTIEDFKRTKEMTSLRRESTMRNQPRTENVRNVFKKNTAIVMALARGSGGAAGGGNDENKSAIVLHDMLNKVARRRSSAAISTKMNERIILITHSGIQSGLFLFDVAWLYFSVRDICNLLLCLFYAFYLATIIAVSMKTTDPVTWNMLCAVALLVGIILQTYVIRESSTINAMSAFNGDVVGKVIEEQEEDSVIENMVREKILRKVKHAVGGHRVTDAEFMKKAVIQLFTEIQNLDGISDDLVSKDELKVLLQKLNIFFSKSKFDRAFELIDVDMSGTITLSEFVDFIFPDAARKARNRMRLLRLQAKGLVKKDGDTRKRGNGDANTRRMSYFPAVFARQRSADIVPEDDETGVKYVPTADTADVVAFKEKQNGIKLRAAKRLNKAVTKIRIINAVKPAKTKDVKLYNTLEASKDIVERHRLDIPPEEEQKTKSVDNADIQWTDSPQERGGEASVHLLETGRDVSGPASSGTADVDDCPASTVGQDVKIDSIGGTVDDALESIKI